MALNEQHIREIESLSKDMASFEALLKLFEAIQSAQGATNSPFAQLIVQNASELICVLDEQGQIVFVSPSAKHLIGYQTDELINTVWRDHCHYGDLAERESSLKETNRFGKSLFKYCHRIRHKDGRYIWYETCEQFTVDPVTRCNYVVVSSREISDRIILEQHLAESRERYRQMMELVSDFAVLCSVTPDGTLTIEWSTPSYEAITGYLDIEPLSQEVWIQRIHPEDVTHVRNQFSLLLNNQSCTFDYRFRYANGEYHWLRAHARPIYSPQEERVTHLNIALHDISAEKETQFALQRENSRYRALFERSGDAVFMLDLDGRVISVNPRAVEMFGWTEAEYRQLGIMPNVDPADMDNARERFQQVRSGQNLPIYERIMLTKDGRRLRVEVNGALVYDQNGHPTHVQSIVRDVTERQIARQRELELTVEREKVVLMSRIIHDLAHDLNTPITVIRTNTYLITKLINRLTTLLVGNLNVEAATLAPIRETLLTLRSRNESLEAASVRLHTLIDGLFEMARLESSLNFNFTFNEINLPVQRLCEEKLLTAADKEIRLTMQLSPNLPMLRLDEDEIVRAVSKLLENALQFTPRGGSVEVFTQANADTNEVIIGVRDSGIGIAPEVLPHIFERFYRGDQARQMHTGGVGLGLNIAKLIVEAHSGRISVETEMNRGSTFRIHLPVVS